MQSKEIDFLNIWLVIVSMALAIIIPFKLFVFSYAILGPLHYLTEIQWLHKSKYFIRSSYQRSTLGFLMVCCLVSVGAFVGYFHSFWRSLPLSSLMVNVTIVLLLVIAFILSSKAFFSKWLAALAVGFILWAVIFSKAESSLIFLGLMVTTLIHVYLFTLLFMIYGAIKSRSVFGWLNAAVMVMSLVVICSLNVSLNDYNHQDFTGAIFQFVSLPVINGILSRVFFWDLAAVPEHTVSAMWLKFQMIISFAYTYHYLNWFSKTTIIGWRKTLTQRSGTVILIAWLGSIIIYIWDYQFGLKALFVLSLLHVLLEFPLNAMTINAIWQWLLKPIRSSI